jgi:phage terminase large subunit
VSSSILRIETPRAFKPLLQPSRYKGAYGGRGGAKSHFFAELLIERCVMGKTRAACIREVQNSLKESVRQLLIDKIERYGLGGAFDVLETEIRGPNGSLIIFRGMQSYNAETIKSLEGYDIAWVEEAQTLSGRSLKMLRPTIRAPGSELWFSWNPRHDTDAVDMFLRGPSPPSGAVVIRVNWSDNPWFPAELKEEMAHDRAVDAEGAVHVWDGGYEIITEGSYFALLIANAENEGRIGDFPYDPALPVLTAWDIGVDDYTAIWFMQENGQHVRAIDYFETSGEGAEEIVRQALPELVPPDEREVMREVEYRYGRHFLPHDVRVREWGAGAKTRLETLKGLGVKPINIGVAANPSDRINAARRLLPHCSFNKATTSLGVRRLRNYSRKFNQTMETYGGPRHDESSHGSDAYGEFAVNCRISAKPAPGPKKPRDIWAPRQDHSSDWKVA